MTDGTTASMASLFAERRVPLLLKIISSAVRLVQCPGLPGLRALMSARHCELRSLDLWTAGRVPRWRASARTSSVVRQELKSKPESDSTARRQRWRYR
jgi:hypothetical protein